MTSTTTVRLRPIGPRAMAVEIGGDVTAASEVPLTAAYEEATAQGATLILLDFAPMAYMNSGGIGLLVTLLVRVQRAGQRLMATGLTEHYRQILSLTRLDEAIGIVASEADALAAAGR